jgi:hypothetical protein
VAACLAGCGATTDEPASDVEPAPATVRFEHEVARDGPVYIEGAIYHVTVKQDGETVADRKLEHNGGVTLELAPGSYELGSYAEVCNGNCGSVSPPSDHCSADVELADGAERTASIVARPGGCELTLG